MQDVDFDDHVEFSKQFVLKGESEEQLRAYMDRDLLDFFAARPGVCCEACPGVFLYYRRRQRVNSEAQLLQDFLEEGMMVFVALMERQMRGELIPRVARTDEAWTRPLIGCAAK